MQLEGRTITFKSSRHYYDKEKSGLKANTVRQLDVEEHLLLLNNIFGLKFIKIVCLDDESLHFRRKLSDISFMGSSIIFSWFGQKSGLY